jgi:ribosomal protein RSM22 (predicted rRNA methylase)
VQLPPEIRRLIEERAEEVGFAALKQAAGALSDAYREGRPSKLPGRERVAAYLVTRMPATYAATYSALRELAGLEVRSILDVGAGTGAASLAARAFFPEARITLLERDRTFADAASAWLPDAEVRLEDVGRATALPRHDLVIAAYSTGEFGAASARRMWDAAEIGLVVIEPGTPRGFAVARRVRDELIAAGAHVAAPCPAEGPCPVTGDDWCHFAARVERSSLHRRIKGGELGHEDEKFSYIALTRQPAEMAAARVVRHPRHQAGLIVLETCAPEGLKTERVGKRGEWKRARKAAWGDRW